MNTKAQVQAEISRLGQYIQFLKYNSSDSPSNRAREIKRTQGQIKQLKKQLKKLPD